MARPFVLVVLAPLLLTLSACESEEEGPPEQVEEERDVLEVSSPDITDGGEFPRRYTCDGANTSPALRWTQARDTVRYVIVMIDQDAPGEPVHWKLFGVDPQRSSVGRNEVPGEAIEGVNSFGGTGYAGPCPPEGEDPHSYEITVYALNRDLRLAPDVPLESFLSQIECCVEASGTMEASYSR